MKKTMLRVILAGLAVAFLSGTALAATGDCGSTVAECTQIPDTNGGGSGITNMKFSPNVQLGYQGSSDGTAYNMATWNSKGTKGYGAGSMSAGMYVTKADITSAPSLPSDASTDFASDTWATLGK